MQLTQRNGEVAAERARLEEASLPLMLDAMWAANLIDIQSTLRHVCRKVCGACTRMLELRQALQKAEGLCSPALCMPSTDRTMHAL